MKNWQQMLGQVRQMQEQLQKRLEQLVVEASAGGGMLRVRMNGQKQLLAVEIDSEVLHTGDREMLQDLVLAAVNEAARKVDAELADQMKGLTGALPFKLPELF